MIENFFFELSAVIILSTVLGLIFRKLKQPIMLAYIFAGIILGSSFLDVISYKELLDIFSELGIAFLLFLVGINLDPRILKDIGKTSLITGLGQIFFTSIVGFLIAQLLGFGLLEALYIAVALTFSSTIIIVKLLSDKKELNSLYAKISLGFLLVQDFVAIIILLMISSSTLDQNAGNQITSFVLSLITLSIFFLVAYKYIARKVFDLLSENRELLFLGAISWCFAFTSITLLLGFTKEIGAFLAGIALASLPYTTNIEGKLKPLRDFFIVLFFVVLGANFVFSSSSVLIVPAIIFSLFVLIGNPIIVVILMALLGYKGRTSFLSSLTVAQISEFSLIIIYLGQTVGHVSDEVVSIITLVALLTIAASSYFIIYSNTIYNKLSNMIPLLKTKRFFEDSLHMAKEKEYDYVFLGFGFTGKKIIEAADLNKEKLMLIDFDPKVIMDLSEKGYHARYGDIADLETLEFIMKKKPKIIISTTMDVHYNSIMAKKIYAEYPETILIVLAHDKQNARKLKDAGVRHVIIPSQVAATKIGMMLHKMKEATEEELSKNEQEYIFK